MSTYTNLQNKGYSPEQEYTSGDSITLKDNGVVYRIDKVPKPSYSFKVDGGIYPANTQPCRCDHLLLIHVKDSPNEEWVQVFIELKGSDIKHAIAQLKATISDPLFEDKTNKLRVARIVSTNIPKNNSDKSLEKAKKDFMKSRKCPLKIMRQNTSDVDLIKVLK